MAQQASSVFSRRRALRAFGLTAAALALSACGPQGSQPAATQAPGAAPAGGGGKSLSGSTVRMGALANYKGDAIEQMLPEFEKSSGIKVQLDKLPDTNLSDKLTVSFASGSPDYDVAMMDEPWVPGLASFLVDAKGLKAPTNFNEVIDTAAKLNDSSSGTAGISVSAKKDAKTSTTAILLLWNEGQELITPDGKFGFDSPAGIKALQTYQNVIQYAPQGVLSYGATEELD